MSGVLESLWWDGSSAMVSLFLVTEVDAAPNLDFRIGQNVPKRVRLYMLQDDEGVLEGLNVFEYDLVFENLPPDTHAYLEELLRRACIDSRLAWLGLEGSFHFDFLLADSVADQIYGVCSCDEEPVVMLDDRELAGVAWRRTLGRYREFLRLSN
ncbi:hypothetical protein [Streptomyces abikoensis]|uniref:hypothetical protein n=1 Tax=Streptomyces abikoensis TaxID=97398 RepID=UPI003685B406